MCYHIPLSKIGLFKLGPSVALLKTKFYIVMNLSNYLKQKTMNFHCFY